MGRGFTKAQRLQQMIWHYLQRGYTDSDMAEKLGVDRTTVFRDRQALAGEYAFLPPEDGRYRLDRMQYMPNVRLSLHEALSLYLAARRASRQTRIAQPHVAAALEKLAIALKQPMTERLTRSASTVLARQADPRRVQVLEAITQGWAENRKVEIEYRGLRSPRSRMHLVSPYLIEPSLWTDGIYLIGYSQARQGITTFKVDRIEHAELKLERFDPPEDFDEDELLRYAWGIWSSEADPETVRLKFAPGPPARRLQESRWHPTEKLTPQADGGLIWEAQVAEWQEMLPWIRGWGADVEVLAPEELREAMVREANKLERVYKLHLRQNFPNYFFLWAKADRKNPEQVHRLIYHMIDVGQVARILWERAFPSQFKVQLAHWLGLTIEDAGQLLAFWASLHDLGKASPAFQFKLPQIIPQLRENGYKLPDSFERPARHEVITAFSLDHEYENLLFDEAGLEKSWARRVAQALSGHHGVWHGLSEIDDLPSSEYGGEEWAKARRAMIRELKEIFHPPVSNIPHLEISEQNALLTIFSGFVVVADWLGSDENIFRYMGEFTSLNQYALEAEKQAIEGLELKGWLPALKTAIPFSFSRLFEQYIPNDIQQKVIELAGNVTAPTLVILESPTGSGKTEAALSLFANWTQSIERPGLYIAMPTTATSDQMHERVRNFLSIQYQMDIRPLLVHSRALLRKDDLQTGEEDKIEEDNIQLQTWFLPRKRSLLSPFGVGTVDQVFLSVLQTKHFFVRLLGLSQKTVIFDEVHAYDAYMSKIFCRLLQWLRQIGASVILLSATLPEASRRDFVEAYTGRTDKTEGVAYPRLTVATPQSAAIYPLPMPEARPPLKLERIPGDTDAIVNRVRIELVQEGCAAVICNTVRRAQDLFTALNSANESEQFCPPENLILFHARTTQRWREETQEKVLKALGKEARKNGERPPRMVVIATQVIEQSLDLDFDVMITDLAPLDLLVQRAGRLQRHPPRERAHPYRLLINAPKENSGIPQFPRYEYPYETNFLYRTWAILQNCCTVTLTNDAPRLIEQVYGDDDLPGILPSLAEKMRQAKCDCDNAQAAAEKQAMQILINRPDKPSLLSLTNQELSEDDDPKTSQALRALTRQSAPGISLVCLHRVKGKVCLDPEGNQPIGIDAPTPDQVLQLSRCAVSVQSQPIVDHFCGQEAPKRWKKIPALRHMRLVIFDDNEYTNGSKFSLRLTRVLGLQIDYHKSGGKDDDL